MTLTAEESARSGRVVDVPKLSFVRGPVMLSPSLRSGYTPRRIREAARAPAAVMLSAAKHPGVRPGPAGRPTDPSLRSG